MLLLMCFSVSTWGTKLYKIRSSFYLFVFTVFGGIFWVICTVTLSLITGSNNYILDFSVNLNQQISFALMFTVALGIKVPVFPFHLWLPEVHSETDTCGSVLLAGVLLKVGSYGLMRFTLTLFPVGYSYWSCFIFVVSLFGSYLGSINCLTIYDIKLSLKLFRIGGLDLSLTPRIWPDNTQLLISKPWLPRRSKTTGYRSLPLLVKVYDFDLPPKEGQR